MNAHECIIIVEIGNIFFYDLSCFINVDDIVFHGLSWPGIAFNCNVFVSNVETGWSDDDIFVVCVIIFDDD